MPSYNVYDDPELTDWLEWAYESGEVPSFFRTMAEAAFLADMPHYVLLRPTLLVLKQERPRPVSAETP
jgi:hypothetical protein